jgi:HEAT repeat protein
MSNVDEQAIQNTIVLRSGNRLDRVAALQRIAAAATATDEELQAMTSCLGVPDKLIQRRAGEALAQLHAAGVAVEQILQQALHSSEATRRWGAAFALSLIGPLPADAQPVLIENLGVEDGDIRWAAADLLMRTAGWGGAAAELCALVSSGNVHQRKMAAYCLRTLDQRSVAVDATLIAALGDVHPTVRLAALAALSKLALDRPTAAQAIAALLEDADAGVRRAAAATLGELGDGSSETLAALGRAALSDDESLQRAATRSLTKLADA